MILQPVANAGFCEQVARHRRICFYLLANLLGVNAKVVQFLHIFRPPDFAQDLRVREHLAEVSG